MKLEGTYPWTDDRMCEFIGYVSLQTTSNKMISFITEKTTWE